MSTSYHISSSITATSPIQTNPCAYELWELKTILGTPMSPSPTSRFSDAELADMDPKVEGMDVARQVLFTDAIKKLSESAKRNQPNRKKSRNRRERRMVQEQVEPPKEKSKRLSPIAEDECD